MQYSSQILELPKGVTIEEFDEKLKTIGFDDENKLIRLAATAKSIKNLRLNASHPAIFAKTKYTRDDLLEMAKRNDMLSKSFKTILELFQDFYWQG